MNTYVLTANCKFCGKVIDLNHEHYRKHIHLDGKTLFWHSDSSDSEKDCWHHHWQMVNPPTTKVRAIWVIRDEPISGASLPTTQGMADSYDLDVGRGVGWITAKIVCTTKLIACPKIIEVAIPRRSWCTPEDVNATTSKLWNTKEKNQKKYKLIS